MVVLEVDRLTDGRRVGIAEAAMAQGTRNGLRCRCSCAAGSGYGPAKYFDAQFNDGDVGGWDTAPDTEIVLVISRSWP